MSLALASLISMTGCKQEDLRSDDFEKNLGQQPETSSLASPQSENVNQTTEQEDFQKAVEQGVDVVINEAVSAKPVCTNPSFDSVPISSEGENKLEQLISIAFTEDPTCRKVFTGNGHAGYSDDRRSSYPDISYVRVFAYTMAEDMCADNKLASTLENELGTNDALKLKAFKDGKTTNNFAATYALTYALGQRESDGNFYQGRDQSASNYGVEEEVGFTQSSANSLNLSGETSETKNLLRNIFSNSVKKLSGLRSPEERAKFCLADKMQGNKQTRLYNQKSKADVKASYETTGETLHRAFSDKGACKESLSLLGEDLRVYSKGTLNRLSQIKRMKLEKETNTITNCFKDLHKFCPAFSIRYGAAVTRINRKHHGPLKPETQSKPSPRPSCHMLFNSILSSKKEICEEMKDKKLDSAGRDEISKTESGRDTNDKDPSSLEQEQKTDSRSLGQEEGTITNSETQPSVDTKSVTSSTPTIEVSSNPDTPAARPDLSKTGEYIVARDVNGAEIVIPKGVKLLITSRPDDKTSTVQLNGNYFKVNNQELQKLGSDVLIASPLAPPETNVTDEKPEDLKIISRQTWDPGFKPKRKMVEMRKPMHVTLHYSAGRPNADDDGEAKGIKNLHTKTNGWSDIGYHFIIPREGVNNGNYSGDIYQARDIKYVGAHAGAGNNSGNIGIVLLGNFHPFHPSINSTGSKESVPSPTPYQKETLKKLIRQLRKQYPNLTRLKGHGQLKSTSCPGQNAWPLIKEINSTEY